MNLKQTNLQNEILFYDLIWCGNFQRIIAGLNRLPLYRRLSNAYMRQVADTALNTNLT